MTDIKNPRHTFLDEDQEGVVPKVTVNFNPSPHQYAIVLPNTISVLSESFSNRRSVGSVKITYDRPDSTEDQVEYDEDEELYTAVANHVKFTDVEIPIEESGKLLLITVPRFTNTLVYNLVSSAIVDALSSSTQHWIVLSLSNLNNRQSLNILHSEAATSTLPSIFTQIPYLKPPHFITGISGSVVTKLTKSQPDAVVCVVLNSEGQPGFEKSDIDSIIDAAYILAQVLLDSDNEREEYVKRVSAKVRKFNGFANSGMYL